MDEIFEYLFGLCFLAIVVGVTICVIVWTIDYVKETINGWKREE